jgi:lipocalin
MKAFVLVICVVIAIAGFAVPSASALTCPKPATNDTIDVKAYMGVWYEIANTKVARETFEHDLVCETANYTLSADGQVVVDNEGRLGSVNGTHETAIGKARQLAGGKFQVSFGGPIWAPYWVIDLYGDASTGYSVAVVFSCVDLYAELGQSLWILSRTPELPAPFTIDGLAALAAEQGIRVSDLELKPVLQQGCW